MAEQKKLTRYLWKDLDTVNFDVISIIPQNHLNAVIIMRDKRSFSKYLWCVQHLGTGHYFETRKQMVAYCHTRKWA
jgi:hypothetical protein